MDTHWVVLGLDWVLELKQEILKRRRSDERLKFKHFIPCSLEKSEVMSFSL